MGHTEIYGRRVTVVDTPPWAIPSDPEDTGEGDSNENADAEPNSPPQPAPSLDSEGPCMGAILCPPGPHAILLVVSVTQPFTDIHRRAAEEQLGALGGGTWRYSMVVFTGVDKLSKGVFIEEHIANTGEALQWLVERCGSRYKVFSPLLNANEHLCVEPLKEWFRLRIKGVHREQLRWRTLKIKVSVGPTAPEGVQHCWCIVSYISRQFLHEICKIKQMLGRTNM